VGWEIVSGVGPGDGAAFPSTAVIDVTAREARAGNNPRRRYAALSVPERCTKE
jgi:hypothetical protein